MGSIPSRTRSDIGRDVASELGLPWRVGELRAKAEEAHPAAKRRAASSGLASEQADDLVHHLIYKAVKEAGEGMNPLPPDQERPTLGQIQTALAAFTPDQWKRDLTGNFNLEEANTVCEHLDDSAHRPRLVERFGSQKVYAALGAAALRAIELERADDSLKTVAVTDPYWAVLWWDEASSANRRGAGHPSKGRSLMEGVSERNAAKRFSRGDKKVSAYEIGLWRARAQRLSFKQYVADKGYDGEENRDAAFIEYWATIRDTVAFNTHLRAHGQREK